MILRLLFDAAGKFILVYNLILYKLILCDEHEYNLVNDLLANYNLLARPSISHRDPTNVTFDLSLSQLIDVDEKNQLITTNAWVTMMWTDYKLRWNMDEYGGIQEIRIPHDKIWKPDVILYNNADALASMSAISTHLIIFHNGSVTWLSTSIYKSSCSINVQYFPFDQQNCSLSFASWTYDGNSLNLLKSNANGIGDTSNYLPNGEWHLNHLLVERHVKVYSCCPNPYPNVTYYIVITRRPLFYVFNMILPSLLITLVGFLGFLIPPDSGEKISMGVTTLLSMTVFLMVIADSMPPNSDSVPLIATYYFGSMMIISLATAGTVLTLNVFKKGDGDEPVPPIIQKIFFDFIAKLLFININLNRELDSSVKKIYTSLKSYYINASVEKFVNLETQKLQRFNKNIRMASIKRQLNGKFRTKRDPNDTESGKFLLKTSKNHLKTSNEIQQQQTEDQLDQSDQMVMVAPAMSQISPIIQKKSNRKTLQQQQQQQGPDGAIFNGKSSLKRANTNMDSLLPVSTSSAVISNGTSSSGLYRANSMNAAEYYKANTPTYKSQRFETKLVAYEQDGTTSCIACSDVATEKRRMTKLLKSVNENLEKNELKEVINLYRHELKAQWTQLSQIIDTLLLYMFTLSTAFLLFMLINQAPNAKIF